ncbi:MAG: hypothetical protein LBD97_04880 [Bifidobacteriaceae bacterium]|jgi:type II secretory pathway pseudopilin PulG|nr:hypothetical protein [Bifidobacteriaceae bacterium]
MSGRGRWPRRAFDTGASLVEVIVSVALLATVVTAASLLLSSGVRTSRDSRARAAASSLAQRELDLASQEITDGRGSGALRDAGLAVNPNLPAELDSGDPEFAFALNGQTYRVERRAELREASSGSACDSETIGDKKVYGTLVTVTVTWQGMGASTRPHVAAEFFPPRRGETLGLDPARALLAIRVEGVAGATGAARAGVRVEVLGHGGPPGPVVTNSKGCAVVEVTPPQTNGATYTVRLLGGQSGTWITPGGAETPIMEVTEVLPGASRIVEFPPYDRAAQVTVLVTGDISGVFSAQIEPASGTLGGARQATLDAVGLAQFGNVYPGTYFVTAGGSAPVTVELGPGESKTVQVNAA